ncbi:MAG: FecR domain-containing protein [Sphingomonas sp.]|uniref:FecR family protein n=1 Tax=Sphingomonas sp. TaxID=28214 RepID=UPI0025CBC42A|nr:FecR domain-containing protein [Sphingomonas sp.]MBX3563542.1 FecR domain-containing protein [Sphingomonas sp.]
MTDGVPTEIDDDAVRWAIRLDREPLSDEEQRSLDDWLLYDERRAGALLRAEAVLAYLDRGRALAEPEAESGFGFRRASFGRRAFLIGGTLSGISAAGVVGLLLTRPRPLELETAIGEVRRVPLADGSVASINTRSRIAVSMLPTKRAVKLEDGEVWFQVAHDSARPFVVEAGDIRVQAVGTAFSVRRREGGADVLVTEGVVEAWIVGRESGRTRIAAGSKSFIETQRPAVEVVSAADDIERQLAWRTGEIALNGESLAYAVNEFNRYNQTKIIVGDVQLGREPLVGYFRADQPEQFGRATAKLLGARVDLNEGTITLSR